MGRNARLSACMLAAAFLSAGVHAAAGDMALSRTFSEMCDASAAVVLDGGHFLMFDDEKKNPHVLDLAKAAPAGEIKIKAMLEPVDDEEFDFEGAALLGDTIVAITSHGRKKGDVPGTFADAPDRRRLFALTLKKDVDDFKLDAFAGKRSSLVEDFAEKFGAAGYDLIAAAAKPPETIDGLNIEGLAAWKDGGVIIGFRGPLVDGRVLLVPLVNAVDYIKGAAPIFEEPILHALDGHGIRDIARIGDRYFIIGGPPEAEGSFALYEWSGNPADQVKKRADLAAEGAKPEVVLSMDSGTTISVLSDDGDHIAATMMKKCGRLDGAEKSKRQFRMFDVPLTD